MGHIGLDVTQIIQNLPKYLVYYFWIEGLHRGWIPRCM